MVSFSASAFAAALTLALGLPSRALVSAAAGGQCSGRAANPEVFNFEVNGYPAKVIRDASAVLPVADAAAGFFLEDEAVLRRALRRRFLNEEEVELNFNVLYMDLDGEGLLVDTGNGPDGARAGALLQHLATEGISTESIRYILLTHGHGDHISGLLSDAETMEIAFPNAAVYISRIEYEYWTIDPVDSGTSLRAAEAQEDAIMNARAVFDALGEQLNTFELDEEPIPGFLPILTPHHTPGHTAFVIEDGNNTLLFTGDAMSHRILTIENPWVNTSAIDFSATAGPAGRYELLDLAVKEGWQVMAYHSQFPGLMFVDNAGVNFLTTASTYEASATAMSVCVPDNTQGTYGAMAPISMAED